MKKVMFVCLGNICRSPIAEAVFNKLLKEKKLDKKFSADSSGTSAFHIGADPDPRMVITAEKNGVSMNHKAQQLSKEHLEKFDYIFAMDNQNYNDIISLTQNVKLRQKVLLFRQFDPLAPSTKAEVPDPYNRGGMEPFKEVYDIVERTCNEIIQQLVKKSL